MSEEILRMENISKRFGGVQALRNVSFACNKGEVHALVGENGAGKSTILKILAGLYKIDAGEIILKGRRVDFHGPHDAEDAGVAMVYQELTLLPEMTVEQNVFLGVEPKRRNGLIDRRASRERINAMLRRYGIDVDPEALVGMLSVAQQQMVEILKILIRDPEIIILDEPTSALAVQEVQKLYDIVRVLLESGKTIIFISHRLDEVFHLADRVTVLKDGELVATMPIGEIDEESLIRLMVGRPLRNIFPPKPGATSEKSILEIGHLNVKKTLHDINFRVAEGEIVGIAGLQGHGQTELLNAIAGVLPMDSGEIIINSASVRIRNPQQAIKAGIALVPEDRKTQGLLLSLSVRENMAMASLPARQKLGFIARRHERAFVDATIRQLAIKTPNSEKAVLNLSGGNQQKVVLGKELALQPKVLLFNEPTRGVDVETKREFYQIMRRLTGQGVAVVIYSSDLLEAIGMSDRILVMYEGAIVGELGGDGITEENIMRYAMGIKKSGGKA